MAFKNVLIFLAFVVATGAVHRHIGVGVGVGKGVAVSHHGKFVPYRNIEIGYGVLKPSLKERIMMSVGHSLGLGMIKGAGLAGAGVIKGVDKLKRRRFLKYLSSITMYPGIGLGYELMG